MDWSKGEYDPWIAARMLIKFDTYTRWPTAVELDAWLDGWITGCSEMGEYERWTQRLHEYTLGKTVPMYLLAHARA